MSIVPGFNLGKFTLESQLGGGGMGSVYKARDRKLGRTVAIKILNAQLECNLENIERFEREARTLASLSHPNLMHVYDVGTEDGNHYFAMEYIEGATLNQIIADPAQTLSQEEALRVTIEIMAGLSKVHHSGIVHRDIKPANIMIEHSDGRAVLVDFGLSKSATDSGLTSVGSILGTPDYIAPEQIEGFEAGYYSDIYSLGVVLYEMLSGENPFTRNSSMQTIRAHCSYNPPPLKKIVPNTPKALSKIVEKMISTSPEDRYQSIAHLATDLLKVCDHPILPQLTREHHRPSTTHNPTINYSKKMEKVITPEKPTTFTNYTSEPPKIRSNFSFLQYFIIGLSIIVIGLLAILYIKNYPNSIKPELAKYGLPIVTYMPEGVTKIPEKVSNPSIIMQLKNGERIWGRVLDGIHTNKIAVGLFPSGQAEYPIDSIQAIIIVDSEALVDKVPEAGKLIKTIYSDINEKPQTE